MTENIESTYPILERFCLIKPLVPMIIYECENKIIQFLVSLMDENEIQTNEVLGRVLYSIYVVH